VKECGQTPLAAREEGNEGKVVLRKGFVKK
jgi:hypothetical protein